MIFLAVLTAIIASTLMLNMNPAYGFVFILFLILAYLFITHFKKMFVFLIIARPVFDIFKDYGVGISYSKVNLAAAISFLFIIGGFFYLLMNRKRIFVCMETNFYAIFLIFALFGTIFNIGIVGANGIFAWLRLALVLLIMLVIVNDYNDTQSLIRLIKYILFSTCIPIIYSAVQMFTRINMSSGQGFERVTGGLGHSNVLASYLTIYIIMVVCILVMPNTIITKRHKIFLWTFLISLVSCMFLTYARGAWVSLIISMSTVGILYFRKKFFFGVVALILFFLIVYFLTGKTIIVSEAMRRFEDIQPLLLSKTLDPTDNSLSWRILYWQELLLKLGNSPIVGFGLGSAAILGSFHLEAHNNYVQVFFETGLGGLFYFMTIFLFFVRALKNTRRQNLNVKAYSVGILGILIAYLINSLSGHLIRNAVYQMYFLSLLMVMNCLSKILYVKKLGCDEG